MLARISSAELTEWNAYFLLLAEEAQQAQEVPDTPETNPAGWEYED